MSQELVTYTKQLEQYADSFSKVLPPHMSPAKLLRMAESAARITPYLLQCERGSLMRSIMTGAILGLEIDGVTGQAYLLPFKGKVQLVVGYKGYVTLAFNSGYILEGRTVRANDEFNFVNGLKPELYHKPPSPTATLEQRGAIVAAYAVARHTDHYLSTFRVVTLDEIVKIRDASPGYINNKASSPWTVHFSEMAKKTAIRAIADELPLNVQRAAAVEELHDRTGKPSYLGPQMELATDDDEKLKGSTVIDQEDNTY